MARPGPVGIRRRGSPIRGEVKLRGDVGEVPGMERPAGEEPPGGLEIAAGHQKAHLGGRGLQAPREGEELGGELAVPRPLRAREDWRRIEGIRLHRVEDPHAGHSHPPRLDVLAGLGGTILSCGYKPRQRIFERTEDRLDGRRRVGGELHHYQKSSPGAILGRTESVSRFVPLLEFNRDPNQTPGAPVEYFDRGKGAKISGMQSEGMRSALGAP